VLVGGVVGVVVLAGGVVVGVVVLELGAVVVVVVVDGAGAVPSPPLISSPRP